MAMLPWVKRVAVSFNSSENARPAALSLLSLLVLLVLLHLLTVLLSSHQSQQPKIPSKALHQNLTMPKRQGNKVADIFNRKPSKPFPKSEAGSDAPLVYHGHIMKNDHRYRGPRDEYPWPNDD
ncbi:hypothetical protein BDW72DRAFT_197475 [Aspergillus terricola var. indicus]